MALASPATILIQTLIQIKRSPVAKTVSRKGILRACVAIPASVTLSARSSQSTTCGDIVNNNNENDTFVFYAKVAFDCLTSVPFNPAVASRFLQYYNDTLKFQSTLTYLKNPPASYQQPAVDLLGGLEQLQQAIVAGVFSNQYQFEAALQSLIYAAHDGHLDLEAGILSAFSFASPYDIVSLSIDGIQPPKVYLAYHLFDSNYFTSYQPSAIASINGIDATTYLSQFAANNSAGTLEAHADWNQLMLSPAQDVQGYFNTFSGAATFYPGDTVVFKLENGTTIQDNFLAIYNSPGPTGPLETGGDFYNFFVLGFYPASFDPDAFDGDDGGDDGDSTDNTTASSTILSFTSSATASATPTPTGWNNTAYPEVPDVAQPELGTFGDGYVSGYFLNSTSTSVLSIPSFDVDDDVVNIFHNTISEFINRTQAAGLQKIVIDVQQNYGGQSLLAIDTFKQFFPNIDPFAGSRLRASQPANVLGETITNYWNSLSEDDEAYYDMAANEWVATDRINANTGTNFTNWAEFFGPHLYNGDNFTTTQRYNLSSFIFDSSGADIDLGDDLFAVYGYGSNPAPPNAAPPFTAENIIILSDGLCHSSCALFIEMMRHEAGVRVVAVGGTPASGPIAMQAPAGSRGARDYYSDTLDANIEFAQELLINQSSPDATFLPNRTEALDVFVVYADINLRDQVRESETIPLQFAYQPADCRIYFTPQTVYNYTNLWQYAADAIWKNSSLCVKGSTGLAATGTNTTDFVGPTSEKPTSNINMTSYISGLQSSAIANWILAELDDGLPDVHYGSNARNSPTSSTIIQCTPSNNKCPAKRPLCYPVASCKGAIPVNQCVARCGLQNSPCGVNQKCQVAPSQGKSETVGSQTLYQHYCPPNGSSNQCEGSTAVSHVDAGDCAGCNAETDAK